jgi:hypothetical protein
MFDRLKEEQRAAIENAIISLPETVDADHREREERCRDHLLARLPEAALVTPSARERYAVLNADGRAPGKPPPSYEDDWSEVPWSAREYLKDQGVDVDAKDNQRVQAAIQPVEDFATTYLNDVQPVDASHDIVPALSALSRRLRQTARARVRPRAPARRRRPAPRGIRLGQEDRERTACHESGRALVGMLTPGADPVRKVSIIPRPGTWARDLTLKSVRAIAVIIAL